VTLRVAAADDLQRQDIRDPLRAEPAAINSVTRRAHRKVEVRAILWPSSSQQLTSVDDMN
jgi:hypothetical protein